VLKKRKDARRHWGKGQAIQRANLQTTEGKKKKKRFRSSSVKKKKKKGQQTAEKQGVGG